MVSLIAIVEIPKGSDRRIHLNYAKTEFVDLGPIKDQIPVNDGVMPIDYGFLKGTYNKADNDEVDVLILSDQELKTGEEIDVEPLALLNREDGDHKVLVREKNNPKYNCWNELPDNLKKLILEYFSYHHKIIVEDSKKAAEDYITKAKIKD